MGEDSEPSVDETGSVRPISNKRILWLMASVGVVGTIAGSALGSFRFGLGILVGTALAFVNYFWLRSSLRKIFDAARTGERPRMLAGKYFLRYVILAAVVAVIYAADLVSIAGLILGLAVFGLAVVTEGLVRIVLRS